MLGARRRAQRGVVGHDGRLQAAQLRGGLQAQLLTQHAARLLVGAKRLGLAPGAVQGQHQLGPPPLPQGLGPDEGLEFADDLGVLAGTHEGLDAVLLGGQPELGQPGCLCASRIGVGQLWQRRPPSQGEGVAQLAGGLRRLFVEAAPAVGR